MRDEYDEQIERLTANPGSIRTEWNLGIGLFEFCAPPGEDIRPDGKQCGCLTMVRGSSLYDFAWTDALTAAIRGDNRIPVRVEDITVAHFPIFAEWQRRLDREIRGKVDAPVEPEPELVASAPASERCRGLRMAWEREVCQ